MRSCFYTRRYRGGFIHSCYDAVQGEVFTYQLPGDSTIRTAKSWGDAERNIRKSYA